MSLLGLWIFWVREVFCGGHLLVGVARHLCLRGVVLRLWCGFAVYSGFEFVVFGLRLW